MLFHIIYNGLRIEEQQDELGRGVMKGCTVEVQFIVAAAQVRKLNREKFKERERGKDRKAKI